MQIETNNSDSTVTNKLSVSRILYGEASSLNPPWPTRIRQTRFRYYEPRSHFVIVWFLAAARFCSPTAAGGDSIPHSLRLTPESQFLSTRDQNAF